MGPGPQPASDISFCKHPYGHMDLFSCNLNDVWSSQDGKSWVQLRSPRIWDPRHAMVSCPPDLHTKHPRFLFVWANPASTPGLACACAWLCCAFASWNRERAAAQRNGRRVSLVCPAGATFSVPCLASGVVRAGRLALGGCGQQLESHNAPLAGHGQRAVAGQPFHSEILTSWPAGSAPFAIYIYKAFGRERYNKLRQAHVPDLVYVSRMLWCSPWGQVAGHGAPPAGHSRARVACSAAA